MNAVECSYLSVKINSTQKRYAIVNKIADKLPGWEMAMMHLAGRATLASAMFTPIPIYQLISLEFSKWVVKAIDKIQRTFLWKGCKEVNGGHCLVAWGRVKRPIDLGRL